MHPPITPMKITAIGTGAFLPSISGVRKLSEKLTSNSKTVQNTAGPVSLIPNKYKMTGTVIIKTGN